MNGPKGIGLFALLFTVALGGCGGGDRTTTAQEYEVRGKVVSVTPEQKTVRLDHEEIPGVMKAMTMNFRLEDSAVAKDLAPGDRVRGRIRARSGGGYFITSLEKVTTGTPEK
jgi:protein SCO1/2